jgi:hypothetical protein
VEHTYVDKSFGASLKVLWYTVRGGTQSQSSDNATCLLKRPHIRYNLYHDTRIAPSSKYQRMLHWVVGGFRLSIWAFSTVYPAASLQTGWVILNWCSGVDILLRTTVRAVLR